MALNQEFWMQQKRKEARCCLESAPLSQAERLGLQVPPVPVPPAPVVPHHVAPRAPRPLLRPMGIPVAGERRVRTSHLVARRGLASHGHPLDAAQKAMLPKHSTSKSRPATVGMSLDQQHKDWNSDDEEIDEFGRKKRRKVKGQAKEAEGGTDALNAMVFRGGRMQLGQCAGSTAAFLCHYRLGLKCMLSVKPSRRNVSQLNCMLLIALQRNIEHDRS